MRYRIAGVQEESIINGWGIRYVIFVQGCPHRCGGCHNPGTWDYEGGDLVSFDDLIGCIRRNTLLDGVTFSGGEPFVYASKLAYLAQEIKKIGLNVITYTGYTFEVLYSGANVKNGWMSLLESSDYLIDGRFEIAQKVLDLDFRGSSNQRILDLRASLESGKAVEYTGHRYFFKY